MDYASAISKVVPGTFVPDLGTSPAAGETPNVGPIPGGAAGVTGAGQSPSFVDTLKGALSDVNDKLQASDQATRDLADGRTNNLSGVVTSVEEANLALSFTMAMRTKLLEAYQSISQMQV
ncbi:MAG: flagellar hook-basal body complex protein FliE [Actinobacteria bacterium]|nr:flagellar hook-basal body complex protein FliE [Actinomycetota bacterium]